MITRRACLLAVVGGSLLQAQAPLASYPRTALKGTVTRVLTFEQPGQPPSLELKTSDGTRVRVVLGSFRYLMENDFNPKAGAVLRVIGYNVDKEVIAREVTLESEKRTLRLRDENGRPLWRFGAQRGPARSQ
jgi:hypothetical protein